MAAVFLRDARKSDVPVFFEHQLDAGARHMAAFGPADPADRAAFERKWERILGNPAWTSRTVLVDGGIAGHVVLFDIEGDPEVTYWIAREHWGGGVAGRALAGLLEEAEARPVFSRTVEDNIASQRVLERNGFLRIGEETSFSEIRGKDVREIIFRLDR